MDTKKFALALGSFVGVMHLMWAILVAIGFAGPLLNFIYEMHFLQIPFSIAPFSFGRALSLIVVSFAVAYAVGIIFGTIWNKVHK
jgi:hypothetical protein